MAATQSTHSRSPVDICSNNDIQSNEEDLRAIAEVLSTMSTYERDKEYAEELQLREAIEATKLMPKSKSKRTYDDDNDEENEIGSLFGNTTISDLYSFQASQLISVADTKYALDAFYKIEQQEQRDHEFARKLQQFDEDGYDIDRIREDEEMPDASSDTDQDEESFDNNKEIDDEDYDTIQETDNCEDYDTSFGIDNDDEGFDTNQEVSFNNTSQDIDHNHTDDESEEISNRFSRGLHFKDTDSEDERSYHNSDKENEEENDFNNQFQKDEKKRKREVLAVQTVPVKRRFCETEISLNANDVNVIGIGAGTIGKGKGKIVHDSTDDDKANHQAEILQLPNGNHQCNSCFDKFSTFDLSADLDKMATSSANLGVILDCKHCFCLACMKNYLNSMLKDEVVDFPIKCPLKCADVIIAERIVEKSLTKKDLETYYLKMTVSSIKNKVYCPNKRCSAMIDYDHDESQPTYPLTCPMCRELFCPVCHVKWHEDLTCKEYQAIPPHERSPEDREVLNLAKFERWQRCPKCNMLVQLETGCNHITCRCKAEFCYVCGSDWNRETERCQKRCELWDETMLLEERTRRDLLAQQQAQQQAQNQIRDNLLDNIDEIYIDSDDEDIERVNHVNLVRVNPAPVNQPPPPPPPPAKQINRRLNIALSNLLTQHKTHKRFRLSSWLIKMIEDSQCGYCNRKFRRVEDLESHLQRTTVHEVYECCGKLFRNEIDYNQHKGTIHVRN